MNKAVLISILANVAKAKAYIFGETNGAIGVSENLDSAIEELMEAENEIGRLLIKPNQQTSSDDSKGKKYVYVVYDLLCAFGKDMTIVNTTEEAYEIVKKLIDELPDDYDDEDFKKEAYNELKAKYAVNPELYCIEEVASVQKVKLPTN